MSWENICKTCAKSDDCARGKIKPATTSDGDGVECTDWETKKEEEAGK